ncbi:hypothetical protein GCM10010832_17310 [Psychroflexus planctonicus]|uniref:Outer membrane protein beta-barrel domain-containing protein n=2 Tax=Psychroflexus planctonicus TaxID=1526575 RepID=A0ABQ1SIF0_9FLAO|nr:hypothetical protein GCM10010832_17310 [Psychroflexus planctonicus]
MKNAAFFILFLLFSLSSFAQEQYTVNGEELMLYVEEEGKLTLLTERSTRDYRFFLKKEDQVVELTPENYKQKIDEFTSDVDLNTRKLGFNRRELSRVILKYNYGGEDEMGSQSDVSIRLGVWGGQSNFISYENDQDELIPFAGIELEVYSETDFKRNSILAQVRKSFPSEEFELDLTELMIGYRFKVIDSKYFHFYLEAELITFGRYDETFLEEQTSGGPTPVNQTGTSLNTPVGLGAGMALRIFKGSYLTLGYSNLVKLGESTRSDFPIDVRAGFKFRL